MEKVPFKLMWCSWKLGLQTTLMGPSPNNTV